MWWIKFLRDKEIEKLRVALKEANGSIKKSQEEAFILKGKIKCLEDNNHILSSKKYMLELSNQELMGLTDHKKLRAQILELEARNEILKEKLKIEMGEVKCQK